MRNGSLSGQQASAITDAASQVPSAEETLLALSKKGSVAALRKQGLVEKAAADHDRERSARQHGLRRARRWTDAQGMRCYGIALTPEQAATFEPVWDRFNDRVFNKARGLGLRDSSEAYAADGLIEMAKASRITSRGEAGGGEQTDDAVGEQAAAGTPGDGKRTGDTLGAAGQQDAAHTGSGVTAHAVLLIDAAAFHRGYTVTGETCEIDGVGPIDVASAKRLFGDAIVDIIIKDGVDVRTVAHAGRTANRRQKAALLVNWECEIQGCNRTRHLEIDHIIPYTESGQSDFEDLGPKCRWHHNLKTYKGWRDGPRGPDGKRTLIPPLA